eukprot:scaffold247860_cov17-Tisochrysis_lutea.AAC.1
MSDIGSLNMPHEWLGCAADMGGSLALGLAWLLLVTWGGVLINSVSMPHQTRGIPESKQVRCCTRNRTDLVSAVSPVLLVVNMRFFKRNFLKDVQISARFVKVGALKGKRGVLSG